RRRHHHTGELGQSPLTVLHGRETGGRRVCSEVGAGRAKSHTVSERRLVERNTQCRRQDYSNRKPEPQQKAHDASKRSGHCRGKAHGYGRYRQLRPEPKRRRTPLLSSLPIPLLAEEYPELPCWPAP